MRLLLKQQIREKVSPSFAHMARLVAQKKFPRPIKLTDAPNGRVALPEITVNNWIRERVARQALDGS